MYRTRIKTRVFTTEMPTHGGFREAPHCRSLMLAACSAGDIRQEYCPCLRHGETPRKSGFPVDPHTADSELTRTRRIPRGAALSLANAHSAQRHRGSEQKYRRLVQRWRHCASHEICTGGSGGAIPAPPSKFAFPLFTQVLQDSGHITVYYNQWESNETKGGDIYSDTTRWGGSTARHDTRQEIHQEWGNIQRWREIYKMRRERNSEIARTGIHYMWEGGARNTNGGGGDRRKCGIAAKVCISSGANCWGGGAVTPAAAGAGAGLREDDATGAGAGPHEDDATGAGAGPREDDAMGAGVRPREDEATGPGAGPHEDEATGAGAGPNEVALCDLGRRVGVVTSTQSILNRLEPDAGGESLA
ncbi:hypothetical protein K438DRAFT_1769361 [Mycena galopus ATCC 62051]|nr:hypothetical protein K438DRAFT_1769361 [Mycena galopus ATCC 62051]